MYILHQDLDTRLSQKKDMFKSKKLSRFWKERERERERAKKAILPLSIICYEGSVSKIFSNNLLALEKDWDDDDDDDDADDNDDDDGDEQEKMYKIAILAALSVIKLKKILDQNISLNTPFLMNLVTYLFFFCFFFFLRIKWIESFKIISSILVLLISHIILALKIVFRGHLKVIWASKSSTNVQNFILSKAGSFGWPLNSSWRCSIFSIKSS